MPEEQNPTASAAPSSESATETTTPAAPVVAEATSTPTPDEGSDWISALDKAFEAAEAEKTTTPEVTPAVETTTEPDKDKPAEVAPEDDAEIKNMTPNAGAKFKEIKAEAKAARARVAELEAKLAEVEKAGAKPDPAEADRLQQAIAERESKLAEFEKELESTRAVYAIEKTKEYQETVIQPTAAILSVVERLAKKYTEQGVTDKKLLAVLEIEDPDLQGDQIAEIAAQFSERDRVSLYTLGDDYSAVLAQRDELRAKASEALKVREKIAVEEQSRAAADADRKWKATAESVWQKMKDKIPLPAEERASIEAEVTKQISAAKFDTLSDDVKAFAAYSGALVPHVVKQAKALEAKVAELEQALTKYRTATPGATAGSETTPSEVSESVGFLEAIEKQMNR
jgi:hypothetical protein